MQDSPPRPITFRRLALAADGPAVTDFYTRVADYVDLELGQPPHPGLTDEFFTDAPPDGDAALGLRLGLFEGPDLSAIAAVDFDYPEASDCYIGLMLVDASRRGHGLGPMMLGHITELARTRRSGRMLLAVLEQNPRGRAFWEREGFREALRAPPARLGDKWHVRYRMVRPL
jgi:GNAT superfamily N-acetyltransferase